MLSFLSWPLGISLLAASYLCQVSCLMVWQDGPVSSCLFPDLESMTSLRNLILFIERWYLETYLGSEDLANGLVIASWLISGHSQERKVFWRQNAPWVYICTFDSYLGPQGIFWLYQSIFLFPHPMTWILVLNTKIIPLLFYPSIHTHTQPQNYH